MRLYELARDLGIESKELVDFLADLGAEVKNHMSTIESDIADLVREHFGKDSTPAVETNNVATQVEEGEKKQSESVRGTITLGESITVKDFADQLGVAATAVIKMLMGAGVIAGINQSIEREAAAKVAEKLGFSVKTPEVEKVELIDSAADPEDKLIPRPPIVTIMGHVDHGKTTLLDAIRRTKVASGEAGGITQHLGAYQVERMGKKITFIDTPGHEAFTSMRSRGAQATDLAILVVAADDGVMPQTIEALNHAKAADVPIIVAVNKMDRPGANSDRVKQQLAEQDVLAEDWGGDSIFVELSAIKGEGIDDLLEMILLVSEMRELTANPDRLAQGHVIESELDKGRGPVATLLVKRGSLKVGDAIVAGSTAGRVRALIDDEGRPVKEAGPSMPVEILGLNDVPQAGDLFEVVMSDRNARDLADQRRLEGATDIQRGNRLRLSELFSRVQEGDIKDLNVLVKADVQGSAEALRQSLERLSGDEVRVNVIHAAAGGVTESDVTLAAASSAVIIGFNVRPEASARQLAERERVDIRMYSVIYEAIDDVQKAMEGLFDPVYEEAILGRAEVRAVFKVPGSVVAGCYVVDGKIVRNASARIIRDNVVVYEGRLSSLKRFKDDVREVTEGYECGIGIENFNDIKEGDVIEPYEMREV